MIAQGKAQRSPGAGHGSPREPRTGRTTIASRRMERGLSGLRGVWPPPNPGPTGLGYHSAPRRGEDPLHGPSAGRARTPPRDLPGLPEKNGINRTTPHRQVFIAPYHSPFPQGQLQLDGDPELEHLQSPAAFERWLEPLKNMFWIIRCPEVWDRRDAGQGPEATVKVVQYLANGEPAAPQEKTDETELAMEEQERTQTCRFCTGRMQQTGSTRRPRVSQVMEMPIACLRQAQAGVRVTLGPRLPQILAERSGNEPVPFSPDRAEEIRRQLNSLLASGYL